MRDKNRIKPFAEELGRIWEDYFPDWRFGQLMSNFLGWHFSKYGDPFFPEDSVMIERIEEYRKKSLYYKGDF